MSNQYLKSTIDEKRRGLIFIISSMVVGLLFFLFIAPILGETPLGKKFDGLYFKAYQVFVAALIFFGILIGIHHLRGFAKMKK